MGSDAPGGPRAPGGGFGVGFKVPRPRLRLPGSNGTGLAASSPAAGPSAVMRSGKVEMFSLARCSGREVQE